MSAVETVRLGWALIATTPAYRPIRVIRIPAYEATPTLDLVMLHRPLDLALAHLLAFSDSYVKPMQLRSG